MSGKLTLISSATASGSSSVEFTSGIDSTYDEYVFYFVDVNPDTDQAKFHVEFSDDAGTDWETETQKITSTFFFAYHLENGSEGNLLYNTSHDRYTGNYTSGSADIPQPLAWYVGNGADESLAGEMHLFSPSSTSKVKHFYSKVNEYYASDSSRQVNVAGYINSTNAQNGVRFRFHSGNFDGQIYLFGVR